MQMRGAPPVAAAPRGTESVNSRHASQATSPAARLPCQSSPPGSPTGTMSTDSIPPTSPQGVLSSLIAEDRPWTVEEMVREKGEGSRLAVVDALAELEGRVS